MKGPPSGAFSVSRSNEGFKCDKSEKQMQQAALKAHSRRKSDCKLVSNGAFKGVSQWKRYFALSLIKHCGGDAGLVSPLAPTGSLVLLQLVQLAVYNLIHPLSM